ncbi:Carbon starvation protein A [hydrothermal vent metagenome]|uniref:Carbon starvation protein A n=1 Tax=hydrothermal vent metagenome TaxID=652676 RepID=A0A3B0XKT5_9ZZZZ
MITFILSIVLLLLGYFIYGYYVEKVFGADSERVTPAHKCNDGIDFLPLQRGKNLLIQLLNISGIGPIFGPILGALYGPVAFIWIVVGAIFAGAVHDYLTGMISIRNRGAHLPELAGIYLGSVMRHGVNIFSIILLLLVGTVFVSAPSGLIYSLVPSWLSLSVISGVIFLYYAVATLLPIDKIIGRFYPIFGALLLISAAGIGISLLYSGAPVPELSLDNMHPDGLPIYPLLFLTISCGALSGFHATQSPIVSRTTQNESHGRRIFYGMMIGEAIIAMIWAAAAMSLFDNVSLMEIIKHGGGPAGVVSEIAERMLGAIGGTLAVIGIIILPITSGDTAFRSARMIIADYFNICQKKLTSRLWVALPLFIISFMLTAMDFSLLWRYFSWANQSTAMIALWVGAVYLYVHNKNYWIAFIPACFITTTTFTYILNAQIGFNLPMKASFIAAIVATVIVVVLFYRKVIVSSHNTKILPVEAMPDTDV